MIPCKGCSHIFPYLSLDLVREIGIGSGESTLWHGSAVVEGVVIETFCCIDDESS